MYLWYGEERGGGSLSIAEQAIANGLRSCRYLMYLLGRYQLCHVCVHRFRGYLCQLNQFASSEWYHTIVAS